jgi:signal transduction histidine kinase
MAERADRAGMDSGPRRSKPDRIIGEERSNAVDILQRRAWLSWASVGVLAALCVLLALLQNHWVNEVSRAEKERLQQELQGELSHLSREFNTEIMAACRALMPSTAEAEALGRDQAYSNQYSQWKQSHDRMFSRIGLAVPRGDSVQFLNLDLDTAQFTPAEWPADWGGVREQLNARWTHRGFDREGFGFGLPPDSSNVITVPRFMGPPGHPGMNGHGPPREQEWLVAELNLAYVRATMMPELLHRYLAAGGKLDYEAEVVARADPSKVIFQTAHDANSRIRASADASVLLFNVNDMPPRRFGPGRPPEPHGEMGDGKWRLLVRHQAGSLEALVSRARWQNLATSFGILLLILATVATLVRLSRRAQQLADLQMNFVAGVSHELRTPLTVIRTAAFNLRGKLAARPDQVERYGALIQAESEKLTTLVEQVLDFAKTRAGHAIRAREPVDVETLIEEGLRSLGNALPGSQVVVEKNFEPDLPLIMADQVAMKHAVQNLVENAMKYGTEGSNWIGITASRVAGRDGGAVEVRVADRGRGIPQDEQDHIFDAFFRGRRALQDQVHGTGLGLNLVKKIVEAHGGTIRVHSEPMKGAEFVFQIPAAPPELQHELAHSAG